MKIDFQEVFHEKCTFEASQNKHLNFLNIYQILSSVEPEAKILCVLARVLMQPLCE